MEMSGQIYAPVALLTERGRRYVPSGQEAGWSSAATRMGKCSPYISRCVLWCFVLLCIRHWYSSSLTVTKLVTTLQKVQSYLSLYFA